MSTPTKKSDEPYQVIERKILQIMPAPQGLVAVFQDEETETGEFIDPVHCLALYEEHDHRYLNGQCVKPDLHPIRIVGGLILTEAGFDHPESAVNFIEYRGPDGRGWRQSRGPRKAPRARGDQ